jgi:hypothetical protein
VAAIWSASEDLYPLIYRVFPHGARRWRILVVCGKGCFATGHPSSPIMMEILAVMEADILLPDQISVSPMGLRSAVRSVATFLSMTEGHLAWPLWEWKASSSGQFLYFSAVCL